MTKRQVLRFLYIVDDAEGREVLQMLQERDIRCQVFYCSEKERKQRQCPSLLTGDGTWIGKRNIGIYANAPFYKEKRKTEKCVSL